MIDRSRRALLARTAGATGAALAGAALAGAVGSRSAFAQGYPSAPVRIIVPYGPGAATDQIGRMIAAELQAALGGSFIVDNKGGGGSQIGTRMIAEATPDGMTLGFVDTAFVINPGLVAKLPYDTRRDFAPLSLAATTQLVLNVHASIPAKTVAEFVALLKANPGKYSFSSAGVGSAPHLAGEQFRTVAGVAVNHVPYKGGSAVFADLLAGHVPFGFTTVPSMAEHIRAGTVRALAVTGSTRSTLLPDVPSMAEAGLPAVDAMPLFGLIAPARVPAEIRERVAAIAAGSVRSGPLHKRLSDRGFTPIGSSPDEFKARIDREIDKWSGLVKAAGIKPE
ncbi:MAG: Bug family tripartite tricarboxylate transporter substrate binding protein [Lautropia sp.]